MTRQVKLNHLQEVLDELTYPISNDDAKAALDDVVLVYADGEEELETVLARSNEGLHESRNELGEEIYSNLPVEAVGEPGQSEGEG